jgi:hypothetical protein
VTESGQLPAGGNAAQRDFEVWHRFQPTERELLWEQLLEAREARRRPSGSLVIFGPGPAALVALILGVGFDNLYLAGAFLALAVTVEVVRQWMLSRTVRDLWRALRDPMDGS